MAHFCSSTYLLHATLMRLILLSCHHVPTLMSPFTQATIGDHRPKFTNVTDRHALLSFKSMISSNPNASLTSWNDSVHFCRWPGITCGGRRHPQRVIYLELRSLYLDGSISPAIANLTFLRKVDLSDNQIRGPIPQEIGRLFRLRHLNLSVNSLEEGIPASLSGCSKLQVIYLNNNKLQGEIPSVFGGFSALRIMSVTNNNLRGKIPTSLTNLSSLSVLSVGNNQLRGGIPPTIGNLYSISVLDLSQNQLSGVIPPSLGILSKLTELDLSANHLSGNIPNSLWNLSSLSHLSMANNNLSGFLPSNAGDALPLLERIYLYKNKFQGHIPISLSNSSYLESVDLSSNRLIGSIPPNLGPLQNLQWLNLCNNQLEVTEPDGWGFLTTLTNCSNLEKLQLDSNNLGGMLPHSISNFSTKLQRLTMSDNKISGYIYPDIGNLVNLTVLNMGQNMLKGSIPASIGTLKQMHVLDLSTNKLSGEIPHTLGNLTQLNSLHLGSNELRGIIPPSLGNCQNLILLDLSYNKLIGSIPGEILTIRTLSLCLNLAMNSLTGLIPSELGSLINLVEIDLSMNKLSGELPISFGACQELENLYLGGNFFHGSISLSWKTLRGMQELDLSQNNLSGKIPYFLQELHFLHHLNLSFNNFEGEVPMFGVFENTSAVSVLGNSKLCGGNILLHLPPCTCTSCKKDGFPTLVVIILVSGISLCLILYLYLIRKPRRGLSYGSFRPPGHEYERITYAELVQATNGFSADRLIGVGSFSAVYKGILADGSMVAVKVLNLEKQGASESFTKECCIIRNKRHRNLIRIYSVCSGTDFLGNDFKAIVSEFMANGSLDSWLHPIPNEQYKSKKFNLQQRINIAVDVASAMDYLHHNDVIPTVHCDIKPGNILLDDDMTAHVGDMGLAKGPEITLIRLNMRTVTSVGCRGTIGYIPPEYGTANRCSPEGDVYSYGILLLEMFTGKRPIDDALGEGRSLRKYVELAFPERILDVMDVNLLSTEIDEANDDVLIFDARTLDNIVSSILRIGLLCSNEVPARRPKMTDIVMHLHVIRDAFLRRKERRVEQLRNFLADEWVTF